MKLILSILACFFLVSCTSSRDFPLISTKVAAVPAHKVLGNIEIKNCGSIDFKKMESEALEQTKKMGGDAVIDFQIRHTSSTFIYYAFYSRECYSAIGIAVKFAGSGFDGPSVWDDVPQPTAKEPESPWD
jgi:hypothetical protein